MDRQYKDRNNRNNIINLISRIPLKWVILTILFLIVGYFVFLSNNNNNKHHVSKTITTLRTSENDDSTILNDDDNDNADDNVIEEKGSETLEEIMERIHPCEIGSLGATIDDIRKFSLNWEKEVFSKSIASTGHSGGIGLFHGSFISFIVHHIKPKVIIESGALEGRGTQLLRFICPKCKIIVVTPDKPNVYIDPAPDSVYFYGENFKDFNQIDWDSLKIDKKNTLIFFDDHQSGERRIREARERGFVHMVFDDNFGPGSDNFSAKQACDAKNQLIWKACDLIEHRTGANSFFPIVYVDNFNVVRKTVSNDELQKIYKEFMENVEVYFEAIPFFDSVKRDYYSLEISKVMTKASKPPLFPVSEPIGAKMEKKYPKESTAFYNMAYVKVKPLP